MKIQPKVGWHRASSAELVNIRGIPTASELDVSKSKLPPRVHKTDNNVTIISPWFELTANVILPPGIEGAEDWSIGWVQGVSEYTLVEHFGGGPERVCLRDVTDMSQLSHVGDTIEGRPGWYCPKDRPYFGQAGIPYRQSVVHHLSQKCNQQIEVQLRHQYQCVRPLSKNGERLTSVNLRMCFTSWLVVRNNTSGLYKVLFHVDWGFHETVQDPKFSHCANTWLKTKITKSKENEDIPENVFKTTITEELQPR